MVTYSEYIQAKRMVETTKKPFVKKMMRKTITAFKIQLRAENAYLKH